MDMELHAAVMEIIEGLDSRHNLPRSELRKIAEDTITEDRVTDGEWLYQRVQQSKKEFIRKRNIAHVRGYAPFCSLNQRVYNKLRESFGDDVLDLMRKYLADPEDIYSKWSYRFASTVAQIGIEECLKHKDEVYVFVTTHSVWEKNQQNYAENYRNWITDGQPDRYNQNRRSEESDSSEQAGDSEAGQASEEESSTDEPKAAAQVSADSEETSQV